VILTVGCVSSHWRRERCAGIGEGSVVATADFLRRSIDDAADDLGDVLEGILDRNVAA
jgi:hypothetical protein